MINQRISLWSIATLWLLGCTQSLHAGSMGASCSAYGLDGACINSAWEIGAQTLYLQPNSDLYQSSVTLSAGSSVVNLGVNPSWNWGFAIDAGYYFNSVNSLSISWADFRENHAKSYPATALNYVYPSGATIHAAFDSVYQSAHLEWDQVNIALTQDLTLTPNNIVHLHAGAEYARLLNNGYNVYRSSVSVNGALPSVTQFNGQYTASYNGFGPRLGADFDYTLLDGLNIYAKAAAALLAGTSKSNLLGNQVVSINYNHAIVVPELAGQLGGLYTYPLANSNLIVDLGWLWINYFNVLTSAISPQSTTSQTTNFGLQGLYLGVRWLGTLG